MAALDRLHHRGGPPAKTSSIGRPLLLSQTNDETVALGAQDAEHLRLELALAPRSTVEVLLTAHGRTLGVLSLVRGAAQPRYDADDLAVAEEFGRRAGVAIENARLYAAQQRAQQELRESDRRKTEFLAVLSHELRNPLAPIRNSVHLLDRAEPGSERAARAKQIISRQTEHLTRIVDDLLDVTRISRGKIDLQRALVDILCDIGLPDVDGYQVARTLRADEALRSTRLIALSGYAQAEDRRRAKEAGFDVHIAKPPSLDALLAAVVADG